MEPSCWDSLLVARCSGLGYGVADHLGELVDLLGGAALGDRDQQTVPVLGVLARQRVTGRDSLFRTAVEHLGHRGVETQRELARNRRLVQQLDAVQRGESLARIGGALDE